MKRSDFFIIILAVALSVGFSSFAIGKFRGLAAGERRAIDNVNAALVQERYGIRFRLQAAGEVSLVHQVYVSEKRLRELASLEEGAR